MRGRFRCFFGRLFPDSKQGFYDVLYSLMFHAYISLTKSHKSFLVSSHLGPLSILSYIPDLDEQLRPCTIMQETPPISVSSMVETRVSCEFSLTHLKTIEGFSDSPITAYKQRYLSAINHGSLRHPIKVWRFLAGNNHKLYTKWEVSSKPYWTEGNYPIIILLLSNDSLIIPLYPIINHC